MWDGCRLRKWAAQAALPRWASGGGTRERAFAEDAGTGSGALGGRALPRGHKEWRSGADDREWDRRHDLQPGHLPEGHRELRALRRAAPGALAEGGRSKGDLLGG